MRMMTDDSELAFRARDGDREAFRALLERHYDVVYRLAHRDLGQPSDAEDVAQEICLSLPRRLKSFRGDSRFSTWLYRVVINACLDFRRKRGTAERLNQSYGETAELLAEAERDRQRQSAWLYRALETLSEDLRQAALLVVAESLSHAEAGEVLGIKEATVSWRMHELRKRLKEIAGTENDG